MWESGKAKVAAVLGGLGGWGCPRRGLCVLVSVPSVRGRAAFVLDVVLMGTGSPPHWDSVFFYNKIKMNVS